MKTCESICQRAYIVLDNDSVKSNLESLKQSKRLQIWKNMSEHKSACFYDLLHLVRREKCYSHLGAHQRIPLKKTVGSKSEINTRNYSNMQFYGYKEIDAKTLAVFSC